MLLRSFSFINYLPLLADNRQAALVISSYWTTLPPVCHSDMHRNWQYCERDWEAQAVGMPCPWIMRVKRMYHADGLFGGGGGGRGVTGRGVVQDWCDSSGSVISKCMEDWRIDPSGVAGWNNVQVGGFRGIWNIEDNVFPTKRTVWEVEVTCWAYMVLWACP